MKENPIEPQPPGRGRPAERTGGARVLLPADGAFVAIDFETADNGADSACAVGLVRVEGLRIVRRERVLLRPPRSRILFSHIHGITWPMVAGAPAFAEAWPRLTPLLEGAAFLAAHNAPFDRRVLAACCATAGHPVPALPFVCTVQVARRHLGCRPANLPAVCRRLGIGLVHHDALSDAEACARIIIAVASAAAGTGRTRPQQQAGESGSPGPQSPSGK